MLQNLYVRYFWPHLAIDPVDKLGAIDHNLSFDSLNIRDVEQSELVELPVTLDLDTILPRVQLILNQLGVEKVVIAYVLHRCFNRLEVYFVDVSNTALLIRKACEKVKHADLHDIHRPFHEHFLLFDSWIQKVSSISKDQVGVELVLPYLPDF